MFIFVRRRFQLAVAPRIWQHCSPEEERTVAEFPLIEIMQCPGCGASLSSVDQTLKCEGCSRDYPVQDGIPVLLEDQQPDEEIVPRFLGVDRETLRYNYQLTILTLAVRIWIPTERRRMVQAMGLKPGDRVLDHCAGMGGNLSPLARSVGPGGRVVAMDNSTAMVRRAQRLARRKRLPVDVHQAHAMRRLPYRDASFDAVLHVGAINQFGGGRRQAMDEILRVTCEGGTIEIIDESMAPGMEKTRFGRFLVGQNPMFLDPIPTELVPEGAEARVDYAMGGLFYVIRFQKPPR